LNEVENRNESEIQLKLSRYLKAHILVECL